MDTMTTETIGQARRRLADKAQAEGVKLYVDRRDQRHYAASTTRPGDLYYVTLLSCSCRGFIAHQRCKHHSAILAAYGQITPDPAPLSCVNCGGHDVAHEEAHARWLGGAIGGHRVATVVTRCAACQRRQLAA